MGVYALTGRRGGGVANIISWTRSSRLNATPPTTQISICSLLSRYVKVRIKCQGQAIVVLFTDYKPVALGLFRLL